MLDPDQAHEEYFKLMPNGNHDQPSRRTLELLQELERRMDTKIESIDKNKVSWKLFIPILGFLLSLTSGMFYLVYNKLETVDARTLNTDKAVSQIQGKLEPFDFIINK